MKKLKETLWNTLENLRDEQLKKFQWFLKQDETLEGFSAIPEAQLERADRQDTVDLMVEKYGCAAALEITIKILEKISRNDLVKHLTSTSLGLNKIKNQDSVPLKCEYERKQAELRKTKAEINLMIQERQVKIQEIKRSTELSRKSAERHTTDSVRVFGVLLQAVERSLDNLIKEIEEKQETTQKQAEGFIQELEQEISELTKRSTEVEQLSHSKDHHSFLQSFLSQNAIPPTKNWTEISVPPPTYGRSVGSVVKQLKEEFNNETEKLISKAKLIRVQEFVVDVTLDPDTANPCLILSKNGKEVHCGDVEQNLPDNPGRFKPAVNVLGKQSFSSGRLYFEVQVKGKTSWDLGICKESVSRKGSITVSPKTGYWTICLRNTDEYKSSAVKINVKYPPKKVGVFVDYEKGLVHFFNVDCAEVIHSFTDCSFTEKVCPFFSPGRHYHGENSAPLIISPVNNTD